MVIWITGISGAGKTTLAKFFLKNKKFQSVYFDGDQFRKILGNDIKYTLKDRDINAHRLTRLVKYISDQKLNVLISANLTSRKYRNWCKKNIKNYIEIFIDADIKNLIKRDYKKLYSKAIKGKIKNVVGVDLPFKKPLGSNIYIKNDSTKKKFLQSIEKIKKYINQNKIEIY